MARHVTDDKCLADLIAYLEREWPRDVVMPVKKGEKHPMFKHHDGSWTWGSLRAFLRDNRGKLRDYDWCVLLHDLCVVDVDNKELAEQLVARFPLLKDVPTAHTARGFHFWFERPAEAEALGYFDGAGQREHGIDFKSVCQTGTGGIIMVPPSSNKRWSTRWLGEPGALCAMPLDLLDAVAAPRHAGADLTLRFADDEADAAPLELRGCRCIHAMTYFEPFLASAADEALECEGGVIPVPCRRGPFVELVHVLDKGGLGAEEPTRQLFAEMSEVLGMLGGPPELLRKLAVGVPRFQLDWCEVDGDAWRAALLERRWLESGGEDAAEILVDVDRDLAARLVHEPLPQDQRWLFKGGVDASGRRATAGAAVLHSEPAQMLDTAMNCLCPGLRELLQRFPGRLVLAGGAVVGAVNRAGIAAGSDWDLFVCGMTDAEADAMLAEVERELAPNRAIRTGRAHTFLVGDQRHPVTVQVVRRLYANPAQVLAGFDFAPCRAAAWWDAGSASLVVAAMPSWAVAMRRLAFAVELDKWSSTSAARTLKYVAKGFDAYVPGLRRAAVKPFPQDSGAAAQADSGLSRLLWVEADVFRARRHTRYTGRLTADEVKHYTAKCCTSDYGTVAKLRSSLWYIVRVFLRKGRSFLPGCGESQRSTGRHAAGGGWAVFDARKKNSGIFQLASPRIYGAMCQRKLTELLALQTDV